MTCNNPLTAEHVEPNGEVAATVLLVEDDRPLLEFFSSILKRDGYKVLVAGTGREALEIANSRPDDRIDILLSDVAMPYMSGIQLAGFLKELRPSLPVLLTSGLPHEAVLDRCDPAFKAEFLPKPFSVADLSSIVRRLADDL